MEVTRQPFIEDEDDDMDAEEEAELAAYAREYEDDFSWERLQEDEQGRLRPLDTTDEQRAKRQKLMSNAAHANLRRGMIRYLQVVIDGSRAASEVDDFRPNRGAVMSAVLQAFVRAFFEQNPLSNLGIVRLRDGRAEQISELSGSPEAHVARLRADTTCSGDASLQNGLSLALSSLQHVPPYGHREVLLLFAAMNTNDPGNIRDVIAELAKANVHVSIVGLTAELYICREITRMTKGTYGIALGEKHFEELVLAHCPPPPSEASDATASLVRMGFPASHAEGTTAFAFVGPDCRLSSGGFTCPNCRRALARVLDLPCECHVCGLTLISSPQLARSYHHLFPVAPFAELAPAASPGHQNGEARGLGSERGCYGCLQPLEPGAGEAAAEQGVVVRCPNCSNLFCFDCDTYIHESLHNCPGCECGGTENVDPDAPMDDNGIKPEHL